ncbi:MAG: Uma2 family endonuclease [Desulfitobacterium sp.]|nr:Uma2 family endonuclease [Desulfitobacterium sp.]
MEEKLKESTAKNQYTAKAYTYADYLTWPEESPVELIEGIPHAMTAPTRLHQEIVGEVFRQIANYLVGKPCKTYVAPFDVRLADSQAEDKDIINVVQPDISVICDQEKLDDKGCLGSPDLIIEVLSPSSIVKDQLKKLNLYEKYGVKEYWIIHPQDKIITVYQLDSIQKYGRPYVYLFNQEVPVGIFQDISISLKNILDEDELKALEEELKEILENE